MKEARKKRAILFLSAVTTCFFARADEAYIVRKGQAEAEIIIAQNATRTQKLAAEELQTYIEKISGARLTITNKLSEAVPLKIYVGRGAMTDKLGVNAEGLYDGAFRMVSGENWLALVGRDDDFVPREPYTRVLAPSHPDRLRMMAEWDKLSGSFYGNRWGQLSRRFNAALGVWVYDECGSLNAVYEFLRRLNVRWYMGGEHGELVPARADIPLPKMNETVRPAFAMRCIFPMSDCVSSQGREDMLWRLRLGLNAHSRAMGPASFNAHGLNDVLLRPEMRARHPEYYAMTADGERMTNSNQACLSSDKLVAEAARYARAVFDVYDAPNVSVMPEDGFNVCKCPACAGRDTQERGRLGEHSDYVFDFVNRVARETLKTHPDRTISCAAYGTYTLPPETIDKLSPNVQVGIVHGRGWQFPEAANYDPLALRRAWLAKTDRPLLGYEHYPLTHRRHDRPVYFPRAIAAGLRAHHGTSLGEFIEIGWGPGEVRGHGLHSPEFAHLNVYVTARLYWDPDLDLDALLDEYYERFYGPAAAEMKRFIEYSEENWPKMSRDAARIKKAQELFADARRKPEPGSVYERRIAPLEEFLAPMNALGERLSRGRKGTPAGRALARKDAGIVVDGRLDEAVWRETPVLALRELRSGDEPAVPAEFRVIWDGKGKSGLLYFGIRCAEPDMAGLNVTGVRDGDDAMFHGDTVELMLESQFHSYYHVTVDPLGRIYDIDFEGARNYGWSAKARVATFHGPDFWSVEICLPVTGEEKPGDPLHEMAGWKPTPDAPWHINLCRQRVRGDVSELSAWSPTGDRGWHDYLFFGKLVAE